MMDASAPSSKKIRDVRCHQPGVSSRPKGHPCAFLIAMNNIAGRVAEVRSFFDQHPEVEVVLALNIVVDPSGKYVCHRPSMVPKAAHIWFRFPVLTSSLFIRRRVIYERGIFFDTRWRD